MSMASALCHSGCIQEGDPVTGAITAPLYLSTTFRRSDDGNWEYGFAYGRHGNPTRRLFERTMMSLEGGSSALSYASGMAAIQAVLFGVLSQRDHLLMSSDLYRGVPSLVAVLRDKMDITSTTFEPDNLADFEAKLRATEGRCQVVWVEVLSNPLLKVADVAGLRDIIEQVAQDNKKKKPLLVVDSTWSTPVMTRPLLNGADMVVHSCTKYIGGHCDLTGGVVVLKSARYHQPLSNGQTKLGAPMSPFDCYLALRSLRTLHVRFERHSQNASQVARFLFSRQPQVVSVNYPGLYGTPAPIVATTRKSSPLFGGMVSFRIQGGLFAAVKFVGHLKLFSKTTSLGATESLAEFSSDFDDLVRLSIGLEDVDDLITDIRQSLDQLLYSDRDE